jgi:hypothetical protein
MQDIDLKKIYTDLCKSIINKKDSTVRSLAYHFPVFENDKLSLVAVFNEVLFLSNAGKANLFQLDNDIAVILP